MYVVGDPDPEQIAKLGGGDHPAGSSRGARKPSCKSSRDSAIAISMPSRCTCLTNTKRQPRKRANAIASLTGAAGGINHTYFVAKNVIVLKTIRHGELVVVGRVLTSAEVQRYEAGELHEILGDPARVLEFLDPSALQAARVVRRL